MLRVNATTACFVALYTGELNCEQSIPVTDDTFTIKPPERPFSLLINGNAA